MPSVPRDVFPETFGPFLLGNDAVREVFMKHHADLLDAAFWQSRKERIQAGLRARRIPRFEARQALPAHQRPLQPTLPGTNAAGDL